MSVHISYAYEQRVLPYLHNPVTSQDEMWLMGLNGECISVHRQLASTLLDRVLDTSSVVVPDAPMAVLHQLAQLLHTGRYDYLASSTESQWLQFASHQRLYPAFFSPDI